VSENKLLEDIFSKNVLCPKEEKLVFLRENGILE